MLSEMYPRKRRHEILTDIDDSIAKWAPQSVIIAWICGSEKQSRRRPLSKRAACSVSLTVVKFRERCLQETCASNLILPI